MLIHYLLLCIRMLREDYVFLQDSGPPDYSNGATTYLNNNRPNSGIGKGMKIAWPARSFNLMPFDFFCVGLSNEGYNLHSWDLQNS